MRIKPKKLISKNIQLLIQPRYSSSDEDEDENFLSDDTDSDASPSSQVNISLGLKREHSRNVLKKVSNDFKYNPDMDATSAVDTEREDNDFKDEIIVCKPLNIPLKNNSTSINNPPPKIVEVIQPTVPKNPRNVPSICVTNCRYGSVSRVAKSLGWKLVREAHLWNISWTDSVQGVETYKEMKRFQKINHYPGMTEICRKDLLARNLSRMLRLFPNDYDIFPKTWCFPADLGDAIAYSKEHKNKTYIIKPDQGAQGRGIFLTKSLKDFKPNERMICQVYITKPLLVDGYKFDLRVYTLITSVDPLRVFVYNEGLARFATSKYKEPSGHNTTNIYMHLTNYSVNKHSRTFSKDDEAGSKRKISTLNKLLLTAGYNVEKLWDDIDDCIVKTLLSAWPVLKHHYHACFPCHDITQACFEILGFDVLVDSKLKPYILEVNHSPSFHTDEQIDKEVKEALIRDTFNLLNISVNDKRKVLWEDKRRVKRRLLQRIREHQNYYSGVEQKDDTDGKKKGADALERQIDWEESNLGGFRRIMPAPDDPHKYVPFFILQNQASIYSDTAASKRREEAAKELRTQIIERDKKNQQAMIAAKNAKKPTEYKPAGTLITKRRKDKLHLAQKWSIGNLICDAEERERTMLLGNRDFLIRSSGIFQQIYESFYRHKLLSDSDRKKYKDLFDKLESKHSSVVKILDSDSSFETVTTTSNQSNNYSKLVGRYPAAWRSTGPNNEDTTKFLLTNAQSCEPRMPYVTTKKMDPSKYFDLFRVLRSKLN